MMEKTSSSNILKKTTRHIALVIFLSFTVSYISRGQNLQLIDSISITKPNKASIDRLNNIYTVDENGNVNKFDKEGNVSLQYSPQQLADISLIEAWNPLKVFIYYQDFQEFVFLDRFLTASSRFSTRGYGNYIGLATISADNNVWCIDYADFTLKKYDVNLNQLILNSPLSLTLNQDSYDIRFMREYQNLLFVADYESGVYIFDNIGNFLRRIDLKEVEYFNFNKNELYSCIGNEIISTDIYNLQTRVFHLDEMVKFAFFYNDQMTTLSESMLKRYKIVSKK